ncbi:MAG: matrixin family metalloprotease [Candidatus Aenigmarchaeota archaeon]|nr:matrixin family metalloprotease [Candidatus Aenigmarchaeota archaeon]
MVAQQKVSEAGNCSYKSCRKGAVQKCKYCGEVFCKEHLKAKPSSLLSFLHSEELPEKTKQLIEKERKVEGGHQCAPYFDSLTQKEAKEEKEAGRPKTAAMKKPRQPKLKAAKKNIGINPTFKKYIIFGAAVLLVTLFMLYFKDIFTPVLSPFICEDGTFYETCSVSKPYYCFNGTLIEKARVCGCPEGYVLRGEGCGRPESCSDKTNPGECSARKPFYCSDGTLINRASLCGCPEYSKPAWADDLPVWNVSSLTSISNPKWYTNNLTFTISKNCTKTQRDKMLEAISHLVKNTKTSLNFTEVEDGCPDITVKCLNVSVVLYLEEGMGQAIVTHKGEGHYSVITKAELQFSLGDKFCPRPVVQLHELLHTFGFEHSKDPSDIMYNRFGCLQDIKEVMKKDLAQIYAP